MSFLTSDTRLSRSVILQGPPGPQGPRGEQGSPGQQGPQGNSGQTTYSWFAYADSADGSLNFTTGNWTNQIYLGVAHNKLTSTESQSYLDYEWTRIQGPQGIQGYTGNTGAAGQQGNTLYTWIVYADDINGTGLTTGVGTGKTYIGIANNKNTPIESSNPADYTWSKIQGTDGVPGTPGVDGQTTYTWFAYADSADGLTNFTTGAWTNQTYLGIAANKLTSLESQNPADYNWSKIQGPQGIQGDTGAAGAAGQQGPTMYTWIAYADDANGTNITTGAGTGKAYIGIANNKTTSVESTNAADYTWSKIQGTDGVPGTPGVDGQTTYTWFAYANSADGTSGFTTGAWTNQSYLGLAVNKLTSVESQNPADYYWSKMQGLQGDTGPTGAAGPQGQSMYTWIAYADNITGTSGFTTGIGTGKAYIGIANNKTTSIESTNPADYTWTKIQGDAGVPGTPGVDGQTTYTWFAYADSADGSLNFTTGNWVNQSYLGLAVNKLTPVESTNYLDYYWSKIQGQQGDPGPSGINGTRGSSQFYTFGNSWIDSTADNAIIAQYSTGKVLNDSVTISNGTNFAMTKIWYGSNWVAPGQVIDGNLLVSGSVSAAKVNTNGLTIRDASGNIILDASGTGSLDWSKIIGSNKPADNATVGATFGTNITGQITSSNVSTYIASAAIQDAQIGNLAANKITTGSLTANQYIDVIGTGSSKVRMGKLSYTNGIQGWDTTGTSVFKLDSNGLSFENNSTALWPFGGALRRKTVAEGFIDMSGYPTVGTFTQYVEFPMNVGLNSLYYAEIVGYYQTWNYSAYASMGRTIFGQVVWNNTLNNSGFVDRGISQIYSDTTDGTNFPASKATFYFDVVNARNYLKFTTRTNQPIEATTQFSYIVWEVQADW